MIASSGQDYSQQVVDAFIVPTERGAALFVGSDYRDLDPSSGPFQLAVYGPTKLSPGEFALLRSRFEGDLLEYANRAAAYGYAWRRQIVLAVLELAILGILIAFLSLNPIGTSFLLGWALPFGFFVSALTALRAFARRRVAASARRVLESSVVLSQPAPSRRGESLAFARDIWRLVEGGEVARESAALERATSRELHWTVGEAFYHSLRRGTVADLPRTWRARCWRMLLGEHPDAPPTQLFVRVP